VCASHPPPAGAREHAQRTTRRRLLRAGLAVASGLFIAQPRQQVAAQEGCGPDSPCLDGQVCLESGTCCALGGGACDDTTPCCDSPTIACCNGFCTPLFDVSNCGACGNTCDASSSTCCNGECCGVGVTGCCNGACRIPLDPNNCGGCGVVCQPCTVCSSVGESEYCLSTCDPNEVCEGGACVGCPLGLTSCSVGCVDLSADPENCGACDHTCEGTEDSICVAGACQCPIDRPDRCTQDCDCEVSAFCTDFSSNSSTCGDCYTDCAGVLPGSVCIDGACQCAEDASACGDICCPAGATCATEQCRCESSDCDCSNYPFTTCDGQCVNFVTDPMHCGDCSRVCEAGTVCRNSRCDPCNEGLTACQGRCLDTTSDVTNCGGCDVRCPADEICANGACRNESVGNDDPTPVPTPTDVPATSTSGSSNGSTTTTGSDTTGVTTLPSTGTGTASRQGYRPLLPFLTALAAASAAVTARIRRDGRNDHI
jgi:hypothetical protein